MKKLFSTLAALMFVLTAVADEGMWLLPYLQKMNIKEIKEIKEKSTEIYKILLKRNLNFVV